MLEAGLRVGEVVKLQVQDLYYNSEPVTSIMLSSETAEKGSTRQIPVTQRLKDAFNLMHQHIWSQLSSLPAAYAFATSLKQKAISVRQIERIIKASALASIGRPIHPHVLRHTFATKLMRVTNIRTVQSLLGHRSITSTQVYTHPDTTDLVEAISAMQGGNQ